MQFNCQEPLYTADLAFSFYLDANALQDGILWIEAKPPPADEDSNHELAEFLNNMS